MIRGLLSLFILWLIFNWLFSCDQSPEVKAAAEAKHAEYAAADREEERNRAEGVRALDKWDDTIRTNNSELRAQLEKGSKQHRTSFLADTRVDVYWMANDKIVTCRTTVYATGAPIMSCDQPP